MVANLCCSVKFQSHIVTNLKCSPIYILHRRCTICGLRCMSYMYRRSITILNLPGRFFFLISYRNVFFVEYSFIRWTFPAYLFQCMPKPFRYYFYIHFIIIKLPKIIGFYIRSVHVYFIRVLSAWTNPNGFHLVVPYQLSTVGPSFMNIPLLK